jgi:hypothetical protein
MEISKFQIPWSVLRPIIVPKSPSINPATQYPLSLPLRRISFHPAHLFFPST